MSSSNINLSVSFTQLLQLVNQLPTDKKIKLFKSLGTELKDNSTVSADIKLLLEDRLKYIRGGKFKAKSLEDTLNMLSE